MYSIKRNLLIGITIVICYLLVSIYSTKLATISDSEQTHLYGTEDAYGRHSEVSTRVSLSELTKHGKISEEQRAKTNMLSDSVASGFRHTSEFSSVSGVAQYAGTNPMAYRTTSKSTYKADELGVKESRSVRVEKLRVSSVLNTFTFLLGISIISLVLVGDNHKSEFDEKMLFLSALILIDFVFIGGQYTMLLPLIGLALLHGRRYLGTHFTPHQE